MLQLTHPRQWVSTYRVSQKKGGLANATDFAFLLIGYKNLNYYFLIHLKIEIHMFVPNVKSFLSDIMELRNIFSIVKLGLKA